MEENHHIRNITTTFTNDCNSNSNSQLTVADRLFQKSLAKNTIRGYSPPEPTCEDRSLVTDKDKNIYSQNSTNQYISQFANRFDCCLGCGSIQYRFDFFPLRKIRSYKYLLAGTFGSHPLH